MESKQSHSAVPVLNHRKDFEDVLKHYTLNQKSREILAATRLVLMVAITAAGRNTIMSHLVKTGHYHYIVSDTTRPMRSKDGVIVETDGVEYFFRTEEEVLKDLKEGKFVEAALIHNQQVSGISIREFERALSNDKIAITDVEPQGCDTILAMKPDAIPIFVLPPSFDEWMSRITKRSALPPLEIRNRLEAAIREIDGAIKGNKFTFVINDVLEDAVQAVDEIARKGHHHPVEEKDAHALALQLSKEAEQYIKHHLND